jgi:hypothetical protein
MCTGAPMSNDLTANYRRRLADQAGRVSSPWAAAEARNIAAGRAGFTVYDRTAAYGEYSYHVAREGAVP